MMNGAGIVGRIDGFARFFSKAKELLNENGKIIIDSSDIIYMFMEDDGSAVLDLNADYYGQMQYRIDFSGEKGEYFDWIFIDFDTLAGLAAENGFNCKKLYEDDHYLYLADLTLL